MRRYRWWASLAGCGLVLVLCAGGLSPARAQDAGAPDPAAAGGATGVVITGDALSVDVREEDFAAVFRSLAAQVPFTVANLDALPPRRISTRFTGLPVMAGVKRLLRVAGVAGYAIITAPAADGVRIERILFLDGAVNAGSEPRVASPARTASRRARRMSVRSERARARRAARRPPQTDEARSPGLENLRASPETEQLLSQAVDPDEQVRERAIEGLVRLAGGADGKRELMEALGPRLDELRHGDEEAREEARQDILSLLRR